MKTEAQKNEYKTAAPLNVRKAFYRHVVEQKHWGDYVREAADGFEGMRVLDLGCGDGSMLREVYEPLPGATGVGVDLSEGMIKKAREDLSGDRCTFFAGDAGATTFNEKFDRVNKAGYFDEQSVTAIITINT